MKQEELLSYPRFKEQISQDLVNIYKLDETLAVFYAYHPDVSLMILNDIAWAQHMGTEYWAEVIYERYIQS